MSCAYGSGYSPPGVGKPVWVGTDLYRRSAMPVNWRPISCCFTKWHVVPTEALNDARKLM